MNRFQLKHPRLAALFALVALLGTFELLTVLCMNHEPHATKQSVCPLLSPSAIVWNWGTSRMEDWVGPSPVERLPNHLRVGRSNPHARNANRPVEVARLMKLMPEIERDDSHEEIITKLGLLKDCDGGGVDGTGCCMLWEIPPEYRFCLSFTVEEKNDKWILVFSQASFSAARKPGFPPHEYHTIYPFRDRKSMVIE